MVDSPNLSYSFYPGCSLTSTAVEFNRSIIESFKLLGISLKELNDWNCCGATALPSADSLLSYLLPARNLSLAEECNLDVAVACNACFVSLKRAERCLRENNSPIASRVREGLGEINREYRGRSQVVHVLDLLADDLGWDEIAKKQKRSLEGLKVAPYYGCQFSRPYSNLQEGENPQKMDRLLSLLGADVLEYDRKTKCCGGALITFNQDTAISLVNELLKEAVERGAEVIAVTCPLCHMNLDTYQSAVNKKLGTSYKIPVVFFTQLLGLSLGLSLAAVEAGRNFVPAEPVLAKVLGRS